MNVEDTREIGRKIMHILVGIIAIIILTYELVGPLFIFGILIFGIILSLISLNFRIPVVSFLLENFEKEKDLKTLPGRGILFAVAGGLLAVKIFDKDIAIASIIILTFADPISFLVGKYFGKTKSFIDERKNIEGSIAGFLVSSVLAMFFVPPFLAISASLVAAIFESLLIRIQNIDLDDNLLIPLAAGTTMFFITKYLATL